MVLTCLLLQVSEGRVGPHTGASMHSIIHYVNDVLSLFAFVTNWGTIREWTKTMVRFIFVTATSVLATLV